MYIDIHVHCRDFNQKEKETIKHALSVAEDSGLSAIFDMPNTDPPVTTKELALKKIDLASEANSPVFYGTYIGLTSSKEQIKEAVQAWKELFPKVVGLKLYAGKSFGDLSIVDPEEQFEIYKQLVELEYDGVLAVHCEKESEMKLELWDPEKPETHSEARPERAEVEALRDQIRFAKLAGYKGKMHIVHVSVPETVELVNSARDALNITCGVTPHHILLDNEIMKKKDGILYKVNPPLRNPETVKKLFDYFKIGYIDVLESDHAPHTREEKLGPPYRPGIPNLASWPDFLTLLIKKGIEPDFLDKAAFERVNRIFGMKIERVRREIKPRVDEYVYNPYEPLLPNPIQVLDKTETDKERVKIGEKEVSPFTIPSGIRTTQVSALEWVGKNIPQIGILTTKSIGVEPREGNREPILAQIAPFCFINAVGLTNPGADEFAKRLEKADIPKDKFLLISVFGKNTEEFVEIVKKLEQYADGFELNFSCPHAKGYGLQIGQLPEAVQEITKTVVQETKKPVFVKLSPNVENIGEMAKLSMDSGAYGICAINTLGPVCYNVDGKPVLTNKVGGISGMSAKGIGIKCIKEIRESCGDIPIIGCGGIFDADDVRDYKKAGARYFGVGSGLAGMNYREMKRYFEILEKDLDENTNESIKCKKHVSMKYSKYKIIKKQDLSDDFFILTFDKNIKAEAGQFVFLWLPEKGEKPFSVLDTDPFSVAVLKRGYFTKELGDLEEGDEIYARGPYGSTLGIKKIVLVGGGSGIAGLYLFAKKYSGKVKCYLGAKTFGHIPFLEKFKQHGEVYVATEDGSYGEKGLVSDLLNKYPPEKGSLFINCGPKAMIDALLPIEKKFSSADRILSSIEYMTKCGIGLCGSCADEKGRLNCVDGTFMIY